MESLKLPSMSAKKVSPVSGIKILAPGMDSPYESVILPAITFVVDFSLSEFPANETPLNETNNKI